MIKKKYNGYIILFVIQFLLVLVLLPGCFREEQLIAAFNKEDVAEQVNQVGDHVEFCSQRMMLTPGVYQVRVHTQPSQGQQMRVEVKCDASNFQALRGNSVIVFAGDDFEDFNVYVADKITSAYVQCIFEGAGVEALEQMGLYKTNLGSRMLLFVTLCCFGILNFMVVFHKQIQEGKVAKKQQVIFWVLVMGVFLSYFPYLTDYFYLATDSSFHLERIAHLKDSLEQGTAFPVRVQSTWLNDHGYAVSLFYGEILLYIPALLMMIGFSGMTAYKLLIFGMMAATAWITYFAFKKCVKDEYAALFGSMIYLLNPYRISNVYNRGGVGEGLAMMFIPLVCCGLFLIYTENVNSEEYRKYKWYIIWGMSGMLQCHLITTELVILFMVLFCIVCWKKTLRKQSFMELAKATGITMLINAWFLVPFLYMLLSDTYYLSNIPQVEVQSRGLQLKEISQLIYEPVHLGVGAMVLLLTYILRGFGQNRRDKCCSILAGCSILAWVLSTAYLPWNAMSELPGIGFIVSSMQYPTRWMAIAAVLVSMFAACFADRVIKSGSMTVKSVVIIAAVIIIGSAAYQVDRLVDETDSTYLYAVENMGNSSVGAGEYVLLEASLSELKYHEPLADDGLIWSDYVKKGTNVTVTLENTADEVRCIQIPLLGYKGYGIQGEEATDKLPTISEERGAHGDLRIAVPAGYHGTIQIKYQGFALFRVAEAISAISLLIFWGVQWYQKRYLAKRKTG